MVYTENNEVPYIEYRQGNGTSIIADQYNIQLNKNRKDYGKSLRLCLSNEFIRTILAAKKHLKRCELETLFLRKRNSAG